MYLSLSLSLFLSLSLSLYIYMYEETERRGADQGHVGSERALPQRDGLPHARRILYAKRISDDEVYCANSSILLVKDMLFSKLHCQKGFNSIPSSSKIDAERALSQRDGLPGYLAHQLL